MSNTKYLKRSDFVTQRSDGYDVRGYWVKIIEDADPTTLQNKINAYLLLLPTLVKPELALDSCDIRTYGTGNKQTHSATLTFYYCGKATITLP